MAVGIARWIWRDWRRAAKHRDTVHLMCDHIEQVYISVNAEIMDRPCWSDWDAVTDCDDT